MAFYNAHGKSRAFTLIELLVVIAIIAILAVVVVLTLNPAELLRQSRDANRVSDMATLNSALNLYVTDQSGASSFSLGNANATYPSVYDSSATSTAGDQCQGLALPTLGTGQSWQCSASSTYRNATTTGWIPVNFSNISSGPPLGNLPVDPVNQTSSNLFYSYNTNGSQFVVTADLESQKYKAQYGALPQDTFFPEVIFGGTPSVSSLFDPAGLVGYWPLNEGSGTIAYDQTSNGNNGAWNGSMIAGSHYTSNAKVGGWAGNFDGTTNYVMVTSSASTALVGNLTVAAWIRIPVPNSSYNGIGAEYGGCTVGAGTCGFDLGYYMGGITFNIRSGANGNSGTATGGAIGDGNWHFVTGVFNGTQVIAYRDGVAGAPVSWAYPPGANTIPFTIGSRGGSNLFPGIIDDVRLYNRALSSAEVQALYNAEK